MSESVLYVPKPPVLSPPGGPLVIVRRDEREILDFCATEFGFISMFGRYADMETQEVKQMRLMPYQAAFLRCKARKRWVNKARQTGFSFIIAAEAWARAHLLPDHTSIFVSYNQEDSKEKINYVKAFHEELPLAFQKKMVRDRVTEVAFANHGSRSMKVSRVLSNPSRPPRGKHGTIYLDELAHYQNDREVFKGSTALILRGKDQLTGCSTPLGRRGVFYEIASPSDPGKHRDYWRQSVPWWLGPECIDNLAAAREAPGMVTEERVEKYGTKDCKEQLEMLGTEDFQQEFECAFIDESASFFPYSLILPCAQEGTTHYEDFAMIPPMAGRLLAGMDVGRRRDEGVLWIVNERIEGSQRVITALFTRTYKNVPFYEQERDLRRMLATLPISRFSIEENGVGFQIAENLEREFPQVSREYATCDLKETIAYDFKILLQRQAIRFSRDRKLIGQLHSIKKKVTEAGRIVFETERTKGGEHGDSAWALMYACQSDRRPPLEVPATIGVRFFE